jgi:hypothetical protein
VRARHAPGVLVTAESQPRLLALIAEAGEPPDEVLGMAEGTHLRTAWAVRAQALGIADLRLGPRHTKGPVSSGALRLLTCWTYRSRSAV